MTELHLELLGGFALTKGEVPVPLPGRKDRLVLAFLAMQNGRPTPRDRLAGLIWSDRGEEQARASLRQSLVNLRDIVGPDSIVASRETVALVEGSSIRVDASRLLRPSTDASERIAALTLYRGPLLEGLDAPTTEFDTWLAAERRRLEEEAAALVELAAVTALPGELTNLALTRGRELLMRDPLRETLYQALMRLLMRHGQHAEAGRLYRQCCSVLADELGLKPSDETTALYRGIAESGERPAATSPQAPPAERQERPVIAVMPFRNISGDSALSNICEGLAEDITAGLGAFKLLRVIDRYSAGAASQVTADVRELGAKLGAELVIQGSLQRAANGFRLSVILVEAETRTQRWAGRFAVPEADLLTAPERIMAAILPSINSQVETSIIARSRHRTSLAAYEHLLIGVRHLRGYQPRDNEMATEHFDKALAIDPHFPLAMAYRGFADVVHNGYDGAPPAILASAIRRIHAAADLDPDEPRIWWLLGLAVSYTGDRTAEEKFTRKAVELNPNDANALAALALVMAARGQREEGLRLFEEAFRLNPFHPEWYWIDYGSLLYGCERYEEAIDAFRHRREPNVWVLSRLAACYAQLDRMHEAAEVARQVLYLKPSFRVSQQRTGSWGPEDTERFMEGMLKAGLPE